MCCPKTPLWREWLDQAERDLEVARLLQSDYPESSVFHAQQAAEKAAKALWMSARGSAAPRTHAVDRLLGDLEAPANIVVAGSVLAEAYVASRYPDTAGEAPYRTITESDATQRLDDARRVMRWVRARIPAA